MTSFLVLDHLTRSFESDQPPAVSDLFLEVREHEILTLLGPSGCGKTTTLRMVAGFETPDSGRVLLEARNITHVPPQRRGFGMVFQHYALFPHLSVGENIAFGLEAAGLSKSKIAIKVTQALDLVRLPRIEDRSIGSLSGGQQQRIALARALAPEPKVLLLDEPLSNLDAALRESTRGELRALVKEIGITAIYVTHDQEEAFDLSDRIAVLEAGKLDQLGSAEELYHRPATEFVATFVGRVAELEVRSQSRQGDEVTCAMPGNATWRAKVPPGATIGDGSRLRLLIRPEALKFSSAAAGVQGKVGDRRFAGSFYVYKVEVQGGELEVQTGKGELAVGEDVGIEPASAPRGLFAFPVDSIA